jgi:hypothetical protein
MSLVDFDNCRN